MLNPITIQDSGGVSKPIINDRLSEVFGYAGCLLRSLKHQVGSPSMLDDEDWIDLRQNLPYLLKSVPNDKQFILLNRMYRPVGMSEEDNFQPNDYSNLKHLHITLSNESLANVVNSQDDLRLFNDGNAPWNSIVHLNTYHYKLKTLISLCSNIHKN
jgi:hypothetical protein